MPEQGDGVATIYLVRHGRTPLNAAGLLRGHMDPPLDEVGRNEADRLGELLAAVTLRAVVTSPLVRAYQTALPIARAHGVEVEIEAGLIDRDYGPWAGRSLGDVEREHGSLDDAPGIESFPPFRERVTAAFARMADRGMALGPVLAVAHDAVNRTILSALLADRFPTPEQVPQRTGCWNRVEWAPAGGWRAAVVDALPGDGHVP